MKRILGAALAVALLVGGGVAGEIAAPAPAHAAQLDEKQARKDVLKRTNDYRKTKSKRALKGNAAMDRVAQNWSKKQARNDAMAHNPDYFEQVPAGWTKVAENVAGGQRTAKAVMTSWIASPGHRRNIVGDYTHIGIGVAYSSSGTPYWTQVFAQYPKGYPKTKKVKAPKVRITGTAKVGKTLRAKAGKWKPSKVKVSYRWLRNGKAIKGATKSKYKVKRSDDGKRISVKVTGKKSGYSSASKTSAAKKIRK